MSTDPTPAPLTDEQMGGSPADDAQLDDDVRALVEGESMPEETAWAIIAAAVARAKREAAEEIAQAIEAVNPVEWALAGLEVHRAKAYKRLCIALDAWRAGGGE